jgi:hypothetical protein
MTIVRTLTIKLITFDIDRCFAANYKPDVLYVRKLVLLFNGLGGTPELTNGLA